MNPKFEKELEFLEDTIRKAWEREGGKAFNSHPKAAFDCVTDADINIENYIVAESSLNSREIL